MALIPDPQLLILDEPTQGMDVAGRRDFWKAIGDDAALGRTIVFATHYLEEADAYASRIVLISNGRIVADGTAAEVKALASGRTIRATLPAADEAALRARPDVDGVEVRGDTVVIHSGDTNAVARWLLNQTPARDVEITSRGLEEAFMALTGDGAVEPGWREPGGDMSAQSALAAALEREPSPLGGFSPAIVRLEVRRLLRNRQTMILALVLPVLFFVGFGLNSSYVHQRAGHGNVSAAEMISIALYGAVAATATGGAMVSIERAAG